jgi:NAD(P)-dependent dehydrogenase (short-subunit alcohol dehydrogenase family)
MSAGMAGRVLFSRIAIALSPLFLVASFARRLGEILRRKANARNVRITHSDMRLLAWLFAAWRRYWGPEVTRSAPRLNRRGTCAIANSSGEEMSAEQPLLGRTAFIAGGSSGINLGIAQRFAGAGAKVALIARSPDKIQSAVRSIEEAGGEALGISADVRDYPAIDGALAAAAERFGEIDVVVSGAAGNFIAPAVAMSANAFKTVVDIDLLGTFNVLRASFDRLRKPGASLISITAPQGAHPQMFQAHACAAKAGVNMLTKCLAMEWGPAGVRVNAISPGPIAETEGMARLTPTPEAEQSFKARIPLRAYGAKQDIADLALFLSTDAARYITGAIIDCDGGSSLGNAEGNALVAPRRA